MTSKEHIARKASIMSRALDELIPTFDCVDGSNPITACKEVPSETEVLRVLKLLDDVFYPGYRSDAARGDSMESLVINRLDEAYDILYRQVLAALPLRAGSKYAGSAAATASPTDHSDPTDPSGLANEAERVVETFFSAIPRIRELLKRDVLAAYQGDPAARSYSEIILSYPGLRAITVHRVAHELFKLDVPMIPRLMSESVHRLTGIEIHPGATIGHSFFIDHGSGVVIGETTHIGDRVRLYQGVTLGAKSVVTDEAGLPVRPGKRHPTIEDDVVIYPGATILGGSTVIGKGAIIGGNVWITQSVEPNTTVTLKTQSNGT
jgi:serine O-acetyltransferase